MPADLPIYFSSVPPMSIHYCRRKADILVSPAVGLVAVSNTFFSNILLKFRTTTVLLYGQRPSHRVTDHRSSITRRIGRSLDSRAREKRSKPDKHYGKLAFSDFSKLCSFRNSDGGRGGPPTLPRLTLRLRPLRVHSRSNSSSYFVIVCFGSRQTGAGGSHAIIVSYHTTWDFLHLSSINHNILRSLQKACKRNYLTPHILRV